MFLICCEEDRVTFSMAVVWVCVKNISLRGCGLISNITSSVYIITPLFVLFNFALPKLFS